MRKKSFRSTGVYEIERCRWIRYAVVALALPCVAAPRVAVAEEPFDLLGKTLSALTISLQQTFTPSEQLVKRQNHALSLYQRGMYGEARRALNDLLITAPDYLAAHDLRGRIAMAEGRYREAALDFDFCLAWTPEDKDRRLQRALTLLHLRRYREAISDFDRVTVVNVEEYEAFHYRALCYYTLKEFDKAAADYAECIRIRPADPAPYRNRALALLHADNDADAIDCLNVYIGFNPNDAEAYFNRGMSYARLQKLDRAISDLRKFTTLRPDDGNAWLQLALCCLNRGDREWEKSEEARAAPDYAAAVMGLSEATKRRKADATAFFNLGQAYIKLARVTEEDNSYLAAKDALERFLQLAPNDIEAASVRHQIQQIKSRLGIP